MGRDVRPGTGRGYRGKQSSVAIRAGIWMLIIFLVAGTAVSTILSVLSSGRPGGRSWTEHRERGDAALAEQSYPAAIEAYLACLESEPDNPNNHIPLVNLAAAYYYTGEPLAAVASYDRALRLKPDSVDARLHKGIVLCYGAKQYQAAIAVWEDLLHAGLAPDHTARVQDLIAQAQLLLEVEDK